MKREVMQAVFTLAILLGGVVSLGGQPTVAPVLTHAVADVEADPPVISIFGASFGTDPQVFLGTALGTVEELLVNSSTDSFIEAELNTIDPGTYVLVVANGPSTLHLAEIDVTLGAVGPEGAEGPAGPPGTPNPNIITEGHNGGMPPAWNTALGVDALVNNNSQFNTAIGGQALEANDAGFQNTANGYRALWNNTSGFNNTAVGFSALEANTTGVNNTALGVFALRHNATGFINAALGHYALENNTTGHSNTAAGAFALGSNTTGNGNAAFGTNSLQFNTTGGGNTAVGTGTLFNATTGGNNTAVGGQAMSGTTTGGGNTAVGILALAQNEIGNWNTAVGRTALFNSAGFGNIGLGSGAGQDLEMGDDNIYIGNPGMAVESDTIRIGQAGHTAFLAGVQIVPPSSRRFKRDIRDMGPGSEGLLQLRPVAFRYKQEVDSTDGRLQYGLIAEEVADVYPELVVYDEQGRVQTVLYQELNAMLLNELQKQHRRIEGLEARLERLEQQLTDRRQMAALRD